MKNCLLLQPQCCVDLNLPKREWNDDPRRNNDRDSLSTRFTLLFLLRIQRYMWRNQHATLHPPYTSSRRPSTGDCSHRHVGSHLLQQQFCVALSQPKRVEPTTLAVTVIEFPHSTTRVARGGHVPSKFLTYLVILCFERRCAKQNAIARFEVKRFASPRKFWSGCAIALD